MNSNLYFFTDALLVETELTSSQAHHQLATEPNQHHITVERKPYYVILLHYRRYLFIVNHLYNDFYSANKCTHNLTNTDISYC